MQGITIRYLQEYMKGKNINADKETSLAKLNEEVNELKSAILRNPDRATETNIKGTIEEEIWDVIAVCLIIANSYDIDVEKWIPIKEKIHNDKWNNNVTFNPNENTDISHMTFVVRDLDKTAAFFESIFSAKTVHSSSTAKYLLINDLWIALNKGDSLSERTYNHIAFKVEDCDFDKYIERIKEVGADIVQGRERHENEGRSVYFYDYDNHLFELHTGTLSERLNCYQKENE